MGRNEFGLGVLAGGLVGLAIGYLIRSTTDEPEDQLSAPETIDLTPALQRRNAMAVAGEAAEASE